MSENKIEIKTPSRLHFGLIDLNGELGRINGSLGAALNFPGWDILGYDLTNTGIKEDFSTINESTFRAIKNFDNYFGTYTSNIKFKIIKSIPNHLGLGSNTQFLLALGTILAKFHNIQPSIREIAIAVKRGGTSGIGVAIFEKGGIVLDGGHSFGPGKQCESFLPSSKSNAPPPPVLFRIYPPDKWQFLIITPRKKIGVSGEDEVKLFRAECPIPSSDVEKISRIILMKILPALVENDIKNFGEGLTEMQTKFNKFGMENYNDGINNELLQFLRKNVNVFGSGISSFGPTIFALTDSILKARNVIKDILEIYSRNEFLYLDFSSINRKGAKISLKK